MRRAVRRLTRPVPAALAGVTVIVAVGAVVLWRSGPRSAAPPPGLPNHRHTTPGTRTDLGPGRPHRAPDGRWVTRINPELYAVSAYPPGARATAGQREAAVGLIAATGRTLARYAQVAVARAEGFVPVDDTHWVSHRNVADGRILDPDRPESLVYLPEGGGPEGRDPLLAGAMYVLTDRRPGPQVGGPLTVWHFHRFSKVVCFVDGAFPTGFADRAGRCRRGVPSRTSPEMLHVWLANPDGPFAHDMSLSADVGLAPIRARLDELVAGRA